MNFRRHQLRVAPLILLALVAGVSACGPTTQRNAQHTVTIEPAGGTKQPTTIPIVSIHTHP